MANLIPQSPTTGGMQYSTVQNYWDALKDDIDTIAYLPFGDEYWDAMNLVMNVVSTREIAKQPQVKWFELTRQEVPFTVDNGPVSIASGVYTVDLPASEVDTSTGYSFPVKKQIWQHAKTGKNFQIVEKPDANTLVLRPLDSTVTAQLGDGDKFFLVGVSVEEGSGRQQGQFTFDTLRTAKLQTFRNDNKVSSEYMNNQLWYDQLQNGKDVPFTNSRDVMYLQREHMVALVNSFIAGEEDDNLAATTSFQTSAGMINTIIERGQTHDSGGDIDETDFYAIEAKLTNQDASIKDYMVWTTGTTSANIEQNMQTYNANVNIQVVNQRLEKLFWGGEANAQALSPTYSFSSLVFNNKNFALCRQGLFDNPQIFGVTGSTYREMAVFLPLSQRGVSDGFGSMGRFIRLVHKPGAFMAMWTTGGRSPQNKTDVWELQMHIASEVGFKFINANKYGLLYNPA